MTNSVIDYINDYDINSLLNNNNNNNNNDIMHNIVM